MKLLKEKHGGGTGVGGCYLGYLRICLGNKAG